MSQTNGMGPVFMPIKVVCINNSVDIRSALYPDKYKTVRVLNGDKIPLTINKIYTATSSSEGREFYTIIGDNNVTSSFRIERFITLSEYRINQLDKILK